MSLKVYEFPGRAVDNYGGIGSVERPAKASQLIAISGVSTASAPFGSSTHILRVVAASACYILVYVPPLQGGEPSAVADHSDDASEYFEAGEHFIPVKPGQKLAVIAAA